MNSKPLCRVILICLLAAGCASTNRRAGAPTSDAEFNKGLDYSAWLYKEPIDILKEEPSQVPLPTQSDSTHTTVVSAEIPTPVAVETGSFSVQVASFYSEENARAFLQKVRAQHAIYNFQVRYTTGLWRVIAGYYTNRHDAEIVREQLRELRFPDAWIVQF